MKLKQLLAISCLPLALSGQALAQQSVQGVVCGEEREVPAGALTEPTYNRLSRIYEDIGEDNYAQAFEELQSLLERTRRDDFEQATILQAMAHVRAQQERYEEAISYFNRSIELNRLPNSQHYDMVLQVGQLYYATEQYQRSLNQLDLWFCMVPEDQTNVADIWMMKASIHAQIEEFRNALEAIEMALAIAEEPKEQWYQLKLGMHFELEEYPEAVEVLKILVQMSPEKKDYWVQLSSVHMQLEQEEDSKAALALAHRKGLLNREAEYLQLASLQQSQGAPRKAAEILAEGLQQGIVESNQQHWEMLASAWYEARELEDALDAYERAGAESAEGKIDLQRAFILVDLERWDEAIAALDRALELGGLSENQRGNAYLLLGTARFNQEDYDSALEHFNDALDYGRVERSAREWINHIEEQRSRRANQ